MFKLMEHADTFVVMKGGTGTISEFGTAWVLGKLYYGHHKPFILYGQFWKKIIKSLKAGLNIDEKEMNVFKIATKREQVPEIISQFEQQLIKYDHSHCKICAERAFMT
jgi:predicted Rossmann-fold nucleotide-binding protein